MTIPVELEAQILRLYHAEKGEASENGKYCTLRPAGARCYRRPNA
ncbi:hypothetical protein [Burkholderia stagnalis]|nr:hypothetical protein [Burkholderia stagnalis]